MQNVTIKFIENRARLSGAAIFSSDMQQCGWLGNIFTQENSLIFAPPDDMREMFPDYPFVYRYDNVVTVVMIGSIFHWMISLSCNSNNGLFPEGLNVAMLRSKDLATSPSRIHVLVDVSKWTGREGGREDV